MPGKYVQYGCGLSAPKEWINFDVSPTLRIQKIPVLGYLFKGKIHTAFPDNVIYGNIIKGLPVEENSCDGIYSSHTLEHLSLYDFRLALKNTYLVLKKGASFRCVVPDLEYYTRKYLTSLETGDALASIAFVGKNTLLGVEKKPPGLRKVFSLFSNSQHLWMWDKKSLSEELKKAGFNQIKTCKYNDSEDPMFKLVESPDRFVNAVAIECKK